MSEIGEMPTARRQTKVENEKLEGDAEVGVVQSGGSLIGDIKNMVFGGADDEDADVEEPMTNVDDEGDGDDEGAMSGGDDEDDDIEDGDDDEVDEVEPVEDDEEEDEEAGDDDFEGGSDDEGTSSGMTGGAGKTVKKGTGAKRGAKKTEIVEDPEIEYGIASDEEDDVELEKFEEDMRDEYLLNFHPESVAVNFDEVRSLCTVVRDGDGDIIDPFHTTIPYLTKYEKARILGLRAKQLNGNIKPMVDVPEYVIDSYRIAELELEKKAIPFIIRRPLPDGRSEYWRLSDLMFVS